MEGNEINSNPNGSENGSSGLNQSPESNLVQAKPKNKIILLVIGIIIFLIVVLGIVYFVWGKNYIAGKNGVKSTSTTSSQKSNTSQAEANTQTFVKYSYTDPEAGIEAFSLLIPKDWKTEGSITWSPKVFLPATSNFRFYNPNGKEEFDIFPTQDFFWTNNQLTNTYYPSGSLYFNTIVKEPINFQSAFSDVIIPKFRNNVSGMQIVKEESVPDLANLAKGPQTTGVEASAEAEKIRFTYQENGKTMEEEIYGVASQFIINFPASMLTGAYFTNNWYLDYMFSFRAENGQLDNNAKLFQTMLYSVRVNEKWYAKVANVKETLAKMNMDQIKAVGQMGSMIAQAGSEMRADQMQSWEYRQQSQDKISENFSDYIRGVEGYNDPVSGETVKLPSGYGNAWANSSGEYIVTESPSYNPNVGSNINWQPLELAQ